jgi:hypothetical protein
MSDKIKVAVILEFHPYDAVGFQKMLWSFEDCECYVQPLDLFAQDAENQGSYDTVLYYNMSLPALAADSPVRRYMEEKLGSTAQGVILLHHALLSWPEWSLWTDVTGLEKRCVSGFFEYHQNETVRSSVADAAHPITEGTAGWTMKDETYIISEPDTADSHVLITTDNPHSIRNIAWTRQYRNSRVFCYASGHDGQAYGNGDFRRVLHNAIRWSCGV